MTIWSKTFWKAVADRAFFSFVNTLLSLGIFDGLDVLHLDWKTVLSVTSGAALISVLKSIIVAQATDGNPSIVSAEVIATPGATADPAGEQPVKVDADPDAVTDDLYKVPRHAELS